MVQGGFWKMAISSVSSGHGQAATARQPPPPPRRTAVPRCRSVLKEAPLLDAAALSPLPRLLPLSLVFLCLAETLAAGDPRFPSL